MFTTAKSLALMAVTTAAGLFTFAPQKADAQIYIERVYDTACDYSRRGDYAGTLTIDCASYRISTRCSILDQLEEAFLCQGYDVCRVGRSIRVYKDCGGPDICFDSGAYNLRIRSYRSFYSISVVRCYDYDDCDTGYRRGGYRDRHDYDSGGVRFGIRLEFGDHDDEVDHGDYRDRRDSDRWDGDRRDNRGRDDWRDGGDGGSGRRERDSRGGEQSGGRGNSIQERPVERPDDMKRAPRVVEPTPGVESGKPGTTGRKAEQPARRGTKLGTPKGDDDSQPDLGIVNPTPRTEEREKIVVREPETFKRSEPARNNNNNNNRVETRNNDRSNEKSQPRPQPVQSPAPAKQPAKEVTKEPSRSPATEKKNDSGGNQKKDRRW